MRNDFYQAVAGMKIEARRLEIISNNLANANTVGFKKDVPFIRALEKALENRSRMSSPRINSNISLKEGPLRETGNPLDIAVVGDSFLEVSASEGRRYVKSASFNLSPSGNMVLPDGSQLLGKDGPVVVRGSEITVTREGNLVVDGVVRDKIRVVSVESSESLSRAVNNLLELGHGSAREAGEDDFEIRQGYLESSNVNVIKEMVDLIETSRAFEAYEKAVSNIMNIVNQKAVSVVGRMNS